MPRLREALLEPDGDCEFSLTFGRGIQAVAEAEVTVRARLPLQCQRSLRRFLLPVAVTQKMALLTGEDQEASLPAGFEALLVGDDGVIRPLDLIEDELILALPVVAIDPDSAPLDGEVAATVDTDSKATTSTRDNPFAVLADLKLHKQRDRP